MIYNKKSNFNLYIFNSITKIIELKNKLDSNLIKDDEYMRLYKSTMRNCFIKEDIKWEK